MSRRSYDGSRRQDAADRNRAAILAAARSLFVERGYAATTMVDVAELAGVAPATAAAACGGKSGLLKRLVDVAIVGDDDPFPVSERQVAADVAVSTDASEQLGLLADFVTEAHGRSANLFDVMQQASGSDAEVLADLHRLQQGRRVGMAEFVALVDPATLLDGVTTERATDMVWALTEPRLFRALVHERGWQPDEYRGWLVGQLANALLRPA